jgi:hypothetical protein
VSVLVCSNIRDSSASYQKLRQDSQIQKQSKGNVKRYTDIIECISLLELLYNVSSLMFCFKMIVYLT